MKKFIMLTLVFALFASVLTATTATAARKGDTRTWKVSYNSALSLHQAAVPKVYHVGQKLRVTYKGKSVVVKAVPGGCTCFDISDEAMNVLASTSKGVIKAKVTKVN